MAHADGLSFSDNSRAESALQLLRSLSRAGEDPEKFAQACLDWSRLSNDATSVPDFMSVLVMLSGNSDLSGEPTHADYDPSEVFSFDGNGEIISISSTLSQQLDIQSGQSIAEYLPEQDVAFDNDDPVLIEIPDKYHIKRQIRLYPIAPDGHVSGYLARAVMTQLSDQMRAHLGYQFGLTKSEIGILELVLRRHSLEQVSDIRGITLNTVRTHVARLIHKLGCHSLVEAVATTIEVSNALALKVPVLPRQDLRDQAGQDTRQIALKTPGQNIEYRRYGPPLGRPVIVLHSLEYGMVPSSEMINFARAEGYNLIFPLRPGFGDSTATKSMADTSRNLREFIRVLELEDVTLVGLSLSAPLALAVQDKNTRIRQTLLINYGLNVGDKLQNIQPRWIGGLLRMALNSPASFAFGVNTISSMIKTFGGMRFYRMLYRNQERDFAYLEAHRALFKTTAQYLSNAARSNVLMDIQTAFLPNPEIEKLTHRASGLTVINSSDQHGVGPEATAADAERLGVRFKQVPHVGRNWMFQHPRALFAEIETESAST